MSFDKRKHNSKIWAVGVAFLFFTVAIVALLINNGKTTDELVIDGTERVSGIRCTDTIKTNFILKGYPSISHKNVITASFINEQLASITFAYEGNYNSPAEADHARDLAESAYNITMTKEYGLEITDFTRNMSVSKNTAYVSITVTDKKFLSSKTAPVFMLNSNQPFPSTLDEMKVAYKDAGFSCEVNN